MDIIDVGLDWVTLTMPEGYSPRASWESELRDVVREDWYGGQSGVDAEPWGWNGYTGVKFGPLCTGWRPDGHIVRVSGYAARYLLRAYWEGAWKCTRIDLQATVRDATTPTARIRTELGAVLGARSGKEGRPVRVRHVEGYGDGDSLLVGARSSPKYYRIYDKEAESDRAIEYLGCVRYEVELKNGIAERVWWELYDNRRDEGRTLKLLQDAMALIGVNTLQGGNYKPAEFWRVVPRETDAERQLLWLEKSVQPVVRKLFGQGLELDVLAALGVTSSAE